MSNRRHSTAVVVSTPAAFPAVGAVVSPKVAVRMMVARGRIVEMWNYKAPTPPPPQTTQHAIKGVDSSAYTKASLPLAPPPTTVFLMFYAMGKKQWKTIPGKSLRVTARAMHKEGGQEENLAWECLAFPEKEQFNYSLLGSFCDDVVMWILRKMDGGVAKVMSSGIGWLRVDFAFVAFCERGGRKRALIDELCVCVRSKLGKTNSIS